MKNKKLLFEIQTFVDKNKLLPYGTKVVAGLSGGPDSIFLLHFLNEKRKLGEIELTAAHLDHEWRAESSQDAEFCRAATQNLHIPLVMRKISELGLSLKFDGSKEELGRKARRFFFQLVKKESNADLIALAHHAQDQQETFFIRLIRGASLSGLSCMKPKQEDYIRPLLEINKADIITFLEKHKIQYLIDPSNELPDFLRNRIRNIVLPALRACDSRFDKNFFATLSRLQEDNAFLQQLAKNTLNELSTQQDNTHRLIISVSELLDLQSVLRYRVLLGWLCHENVPFTPTQPFLDEILRFLQQPESKAHTIHPSWKIVKKKNLAYLEIITSHCPIQTYSQPL